MPAIFNYLVASDLGFLLKGMFWFYDKNTTISLYYPKKGVSLHSLFRNDLYGV